MAKLISLGEVVTRGEKKMLEYLQRSLPGDWLVLGNPQITTGELTRELDALFRSEEYQPFVHVRLTMLQKA